MYYDKVQNMLLMRLYFMLISNEQGIFRFFKKRLVGDGWNLNDLKKMCEMMDGR